MLGVVKLKNRQFGCFARETTFLSKFSLPPKKLYGTPQKKYNQKYNFGCIDFFRLFGYNYCLLSRSSGDVGDMKNCEGGKERNAKRPMRKYLKIGENFR